jgi:creatinine amidohydrolase/Fe(II)-dependent formamide hydrolase-like protein
LARSPSPRQIGELTFPEISGKLKTASILCLPIGAIEQHGAHLPLNTDVVVAEELTRELIARWGDAFDLWQLPTLSVSLSREHDWAAGTLSLSVQTFAALLMDMGRAVVRALPARNLVIVNGHGGIRGILENLLHELRGDLAINACVIHPFDLVKSAIGATVPDVHGGVGETSVMLALAPDLVRRSMMARAEPPPAPDGAAALIYDRAVTWPWRSDDARLARMGIIGDPRGASAEQGRAMVESMVEKAGGVFALLLENQSLMGKTSP